MSLADLSFSSSDDDEIPTPNKQKVLAEMVFNDRKRQLFTSSNDAVMYDNNQIEINEDEDDDPPPQPPPPKKTKKVALGQPSTSVKITDHEIDRVIKQMNNSGKDKKPKKNGRDHRYKWMIYILTK